MLTPIYLNEDHAVRWGTNSTNGAYVDDVGYLNSATVTYVLKDALGTTIASGTCPYVAASNGLYLGTIESSELTALVAGSLYTLDITLSQAPYNASRRINLEAKYRGAV